MVAKYRYLVIGGGMTADAALHGIRKHDSSGSIGLIGAEPHPPYNRPPLSKALWKGEAEDSVWRKTGETGAELHLGRRAVALDAPRRRAIDAQGTTYEYETLLLATGGAPRRLPGAPDGVIYFRTLDDYRTSRQLADRKARFVVVGGGFIGTEVAAALRMQQCEVTMIVPQQGLGARVLPADLSRHLVDYYRKEGVTVLIGESVEGIEAAKGGYRIQTKSAGAIAADAVVAGLGIELNTELAQQAGLTASDGIVVDDQLRTSRPEIYAAGDVASFLNPALGKRLRVEHEDNANTMGDVAGQNMAGAGLRYDHLPFFYSDLFKLGYEAVGEVDVRHEIVADWKDPMREGVVYYLEAGRVRGVLLWNTWEQVDAARALIAEPGPFRAGDLKGRLPAPR
jgi:3-phenylpropionate/trans-cinnamate dioxygenase ferredoxin reductase component